MKTPCQNHADPKKEPLKPGPAAALWWCPNVSYQSLNHLYSYWMLNALLFFLTSFPTRLPCIEREGEIENAWLQRPLPPLTPPYKGNYRE